MDRGREQLGMVGTREVGREQGHRRQVDLASRDQVEDDRVLAGETGGAHPPEGRRLGEMQAVGAVGEHGRARRLPVQPAGVDLGEVGEEQRGVLSILADEPGELGEELARRDA